LRPIAADCDRGAKQIVTKTTGWVTVIAQNTETLEKYVREVKPYKGNGQQKMPWKKLEA
jgi:hypothetical protein